MSEAEKFDAYRNEYERHAIGARAMAVGAQRDHDGRFLKGIKDNKVSKLLDPVKK
jgi:hypothetical protein